MPLPHKGAPRLPKEVTQAHRELVAIYKAAARRIERQLHAAALTDFQSFRMGEQLRQIQATIAALDAVAASYAKKLADPSYQLGADLSTAAISKAGVAATMGNLVATDAVSAVADQMAMDLLSANRSMEQQSRRILRATQQKLISERQINEAISRGLVEGETRRQVSDRLLRMLRKEAGEGVSVVINGRRYDPGYYAELVARTRTREAVTEGAIRTGLAYGVELFQVSVHANPCQEVCAALQGKVFSVTEGTGFPMLQRRPPYHPNCKHVLTAWIPESDEEEERLRRFSRSKVSTDSYEAFMAEISPAA